MGLGQGSQIRPTVFGIRPKYGQKHGQARPKYGQANKKHQKHVWNFGVTENAAKKYGHKYGQAKPKYGHTRPGQLFLCGFATPGLGRQYINSPPTLIRAIHHAN